MPDTSDPDRVPLKAAKTVLYANRPRFTMFLPEEAYQLLLSFAKASGCSVNDAASKILAQEFGIVWEPAVKAMTVEELREANAKATRRYYYKHIEKTRTKAREWNRAHAAERNEKKRKQRAEARAEHIKKFGRYKNDRKFQYPSEWETLPEEEKKRLKQLTRQMSSLALKDVKLYMDGLRERSTRFIPTVQMTDVKCEYNSLKHKNANPERIAMVQDRVKAKEELAKLESVMNETVDHAWTEDEIARNPRCDINVRRGLIRCTRCKFFTCRHSDGICLKNGFLAKKDTWCPNFIDRTLFYSGRIKKAYTHERKMYRRKPSDAISDERTDV